MATLARIVQRPQTSVSVSASTRLSRLRAVFLIMVAFVVYFSISKPANASSHKKATSVAFVEAHESRIDDERSIPCDHGSGEDPESDCSDGFQMDEFVATLLPIDLLYRVCRYELEDMHLSLPAHTRSLEDPPDASV